MEMQMKEEGRALTLSLSGELDHHSARETVRKLEYAVEARMPHALALDFSGVTFMDSSGIAVVMRARKRMTALGGEIALENVPAQAKKVFDAAGIARFITIRSGGKS